MSNAAQKMIKARATLVMGNPFFGTLALRLKMVEDKSVKTSSTDGTVLRYNPDAVAAPLLPWLAWGRDVLGWPSDPDETQRRQLTARSWHLHRRMGTL